MQEQAFPQASSIENLTDPQQAALQRARRRQVHLALTAAGIFSLALLLVGCTGVVDSETPHDTVATAGSAGSSAGATGSSAGATNCDGDPCVAKIFGATGCALCHQSKGMDMGGLKSAGLDLQSPNPSTRLKGVPATHGDLPMGKNTDCPTGDFLVDESNAANSWLWKKINGQQGNCGDSMPPTVAFSATDKGCIQTYIECLTGMPLTPGVGGGVGSAGTASGGGGGAVGATSGGGGAGGTG